MQNSTAKAKFNSSRQQLSSALNNLEKIIKKNLDIKKLLICQNTRLTCLFIIWLGQNYLYLVQFSFLKKDFYIYPKSEENSYLVGWPYKDEEDYIAYKKGLLTGLKEESKKRLKNDN